MTKMGQKLIKIAQKSCCFCTFSVFVLLNFIPLYPPCTATVPHYPLPSVAAAEQSHNPVTICRTDGQKTLYWTENRAHDPSESVKRVMPKITSWKSRGARAPVPHSWRRQWTHGCASHPAKISVGLVSVAASRVIIMIFSIILNYLRGRTSYPVNNLN